MQQKKNNLSKRVLFLLTLGITLMFPTHSFSINHLKAVHETTTTTTTTTTRERVQLKYTQRHSRLKTNNNLYTDGIKIKRDLSVLKEFQDQRALDEEQIPADDLYGGIWADTHVNIYNTVKNVPDTFDVNLSNFTMPTKGSKMGYITSDFGPRRNHHRMHYGIDIKVKTGDTIHAAFDGMVRLTQYDKHGYGHFVMLRHSNGLETLYGHLSKLLVHPDQVVKSGDPIGLGGSTGHSTGSHLHFEFRYVGKAFNPKKIIDFDKCQCRWKHYVITSNTFDYSVYKYRGRTYAYMINPNAKNKGIPSKKILDKSSYYRIRRGDTLAKIARKSGLTIHDLCKLNHISSRTTLHLGRTLKI